MPTLSERRAILDKIISVIDTKFMGPEVDTTALRARHEAAILAAETSEDFESAVNGLLKDLGVSHTGFFHEGTPRAAARVALAATFMKAETADGLRWMFQDVHPGGVAALAGIVPGDILLSIGGKDFVPPQSMPFSLGERYDVVVRKHDDSTARLMLDVPKSKDKSRPLVVPNQVVTTRRLDGGIGYLRVSMFPGVLGMDVARDMSRAVTELACDRLVLDLRGNTGGGIGCLRLMSLMCRDRRGVGYSVGRATARKGYRKEELPVFDQIPASKLGVVPLMIRFATAGGSVAVWTENLGARPWHGRVALLVNEHSASASEIVAAFASEYGLATLVGVRTPGRVVAASAQNVGCGYRVALPVGAYYTWQGMSLEGRGVEPDVPEPAGPEAVRAAEDSQLFRAVRVL